MPKQVSSKFVPSWNRMIRAMMACKDAFDLHVKYLKHHPKEEDLPNYSAQRFSRFISGRSDFFIAMPDLLRQVRTNGGFDAFLLTGELRHRETNTDSVESTKEKKDE